MINKRSLTAIVLSASLTSLGPSLAIAQPATQQVAQPTGNQPATEPSAQDNSASTETEKLVSESKSSAEAEANFKFLVKPKPLSEHVQRGLEYLVSQQQFDGGWSQGGGWRQAAAGGREEGSQVNHPSDLGNTCIALLALERAGHTAAKGKYQKNVVSGLEHICKSVEAADEQSLYVTEARGTQLQSKIGLYVDTFMTALALTELKRGIVDKPLADRVQAALAKTIRKIEKNQSEDGTFHGNQGWASVLSLAMCSKAINRAAEQGVQVSDLALKRDALQTQAAQEAIVGGAATSDTAASELGGSTAGVDLYGVSGNAARFADQTRRSEKQKDEAQQVLADSKASDEEKAKAKSQIDAAEQVEKSTKDAKKNLVDKLSSEKFVSGFGNNGGEEFLSYMNIGEALIQEGGNDWVKWDNAMTSKLNSIQNQDGSWSGHHCITGRTFCTGTALLTLMTDRMTVPLSSKLKTR